MKHPFGKSGAFVKNVRAEMDEDITTSELYRSMQQWGWNEKFPAFVDENDVVLVGHRRLKCAKALKIEPVIKTVRFGEGDAADAERVKLALISNIGFNLLSKADRQHIAEYLYGKRGEWTMERIAEALNVDQATVSRDLGNLCTMHKSKPTKTASNPKGAGRPKNSGKRKTKPRQTDSKEDVIVALHNKGMSSPEIAAQVGVEGRAVRHAIEREEIKREAKADPDIDPASLSQTAQQKFDIAIRQHKRKLDLEFHQRVLDEVRKRIDGLVLPSWKKRIDEAQELYKHRRGAMDKLTFNKIRRALHPDSRNSISDKVLADAFDTFMGLEKFLLDEKDSPTEIGPLPNSLAEWDKMKAAAKAQRVNNKRAPART